MPIRYKVVKRKTRCSAIINGNSRYARRYLPGIITVAEEGTLGIMTFRIKTAAEEWAHHFNNQSWTYNDQPKLMVIKVEGIGRGYVPITVATDFTTDALDDFYSSDYDSGYPFSSPDDTICYKAVRVLE